MKRDMDQTNEMMKEINRALLLVNLLNAPLHVSALAIRNPHGSISGDESRFPLLFADFMFEVVATTMFRLSLDKGLRPLLSMCATSLQEYHRASLG
jgi:hypothetical protein